MRLIQRRKHRSTQSNVQISRPERIVVVVASWRWNLPHRILVSAFEQQSRLAVVFFLSRQLRKAVIPGDTAPPPPEMHCAVLETDWIWTMPLTPGTGRSCHCCALAPSLHCSIRSFPATFDTHVCASWMRNVNVPGVCNTHRPGQADHMHHSHWHKNMRACGCLCK